MTENKDAHGYLEPWMKGPCEVKANGYVYPCEILNRSVLGKENYLIRILLPNSGTHSMVVTKDTLMSRAHYNPLFDSEKKEHQRREEFLYPIGSFVKTKFHDKKISGKVTKYNSATGEYTVLFDHDENGRYAIQRDEKDLKLDKKAKAAFDAARVNEMIVNGETGAAEGVVPNREKSEPASVKVTVTRIPAEEKELPFKLGDKVEVRTSKTVHGELWVPAVITRQDTSNPYTPISGSRWMVKFPNQTLQWSYPADRIKLVNSVTEEVKEEVKEEPKVENKEEAFNTGNTVEIIDGIFKGERATVVRKYYEVIPLKKNYWVVKMHDGSFKERIVAEENLKLYTPEKPKEEEKVTEEKSEIDEVIDVVTSFFGELIGQVPPDFKKFMDILGPIKEYKGKGK